MKSVILFLTIFGGSLTLLSQGNVKYYDNGNKKYEEIKINDSIFKISYYPNGNKKSEIYLDKNNTFVGYKSWYETGQLYQEHDLVKERMEKGALDLSFITWKNIDSVSIYNMINEQEDISNSTLNRGDTVFFHYKCLDDLGYEYDNSLERNEPLRIIIGSDKYYLKALSDAISTLSVGDKVYIRIPVKYGYGDKAAGNVPPNTILVYYVEILKKTE